MDLLGPSIQQLFELCKMNFSLKTVLMLADQMLDRLEHLHYHAIMHRGVTPKNFVMGTGDNKASYSNDFPSKL